MNDESKTNQELLEENTSLKKRIQELERSEAERQRVEEELFVSRNRLSRAELVSRCGHWEFDLGSARAFASDGARNIYGLSGREWTVEEVKRIPLPEYRGVLDNALRELIHENRPYHVEFKIRRPDTGEVVDILSVAEYDGERNVVFGIIQDITERKRAEERLREAQARYRMLFDHAPYGIVILDPLTTQCVEFNETAHRQLGYSREEFAGLTISDFEAAETPEDTRRRIADVIRHGRVDFETLHRTRQGQIKNVQVTAQVTEISGHAVYHCVWHDITERKKAEEGLRLSEATLKSVFSAAPVGIVITDVNRVPKWMNETMYSIMGYSVEDQKGAGARLFYASEEEYARVGRVMFDAIERGGVGTTDTQWVHKNGEIRDVHLRGAAIDPRNKETGLVFTAVDVTSRKQSEQSLQESEAKYRMVVENSLVGFGIIQDNVMRFANERWCAIFGYEPVEVIDRLDPLVTVHPEDREMVQRLIESRVAGALDRVEYEFRGLRKDGSPITLKVIGGKMVYRGRPAATSTIVDVTREKNLESQLRQSQKMESIGTLAGGIAHDFNNILTAIIGYGSLLQMGMGNDPKRQYVDQLLASSQKAAILTQSLLAFSRKQAMELKPRRINEIVREAQKLLKRLLTEDIEFTVIRADPDITVEADVTQIDQVLMNLATNARDAMPTGGKLTVETKAVHLDKNFIEAHGFDGPGEYALISVTDTGRGMDHEMQEKIFEPFFTTKEMGKGTGLGLSIVYGIVTQHKGYITVSSEPHKGTRFDVYLPVVKVPPEQPKQSHEHIRGGKETILFAEDSNEVRGLASEVLTKKGYTVIEARNGDDAVRQFMEHRDEIALLLFDVVMPEKNGKEAYEEIRRVSPDVKVLFTSGYTGDIVLIKGISDEAINYISKPLTPNELLKKVREVLDKRS